MRKLLLVLAGLIGAVGCAIDEADFPEAYGDASCDKYRQCDRGDYDSNYDEHSACVEDVAEFADSIADAADFFGGEYDPEQARACVNAIRGASCEEYDDGDYGGECDPGVLWQ